jgi:flavin-dependent dehydrogenase
MIPTLKCDVLVFGAGPAGGVCAAKLAKEGFEVICVDKGKIPGYSHSSKIDITESKGIEKIIKELKLDYLTKSNKSIWFSPNNKFTFVSKVHDLFFLRGKSKDSLDYSIFLAMKSNGVDIWFNSNPTKINFINGFCESILVIRDKKKFLVKSKIIVVASGNDSFFHNELGVIKINPVPIVGFGALMSNLSMENNSTNIFFDSVYAPGGYFFVGRVSKDIGVAMIVASKKKLKQSIRKYFYEFIEKNSELYGIILGAKTINFNSGEREIVQVSPKVISNIAFCGDAVGTMSSIFAYGVNPAIKSGYMLAEKIIENGLNQESLKKYDLELKKMLGNQNQNFLMRRIFDKLSNTDFDFVVETANYLHSKQHLDDLVDSNEYKIKNLLKALIRKPHKTSKLLLKGIYSFFSNG